MSAPRKREEFVARVNSLDLLSSIFRDETKSNNEDLPPLQVNHRDLERYGGSEFFSRCKCCGSGSLFGHRDPATRKLQTEDKCSVCSRKYIYLDIVPAITLQYK